MSITTFERAEIRLKAFQLFEGWGDVENPKAESLIDRMPTPWNLTKRMKYADQLAEWALTEASQK